MGLLDKARDVAKQAGDMASKAVDDVSSSIAAGGDGSRVIYTGTYSKPFATGARVGFGPVTVQPEALQVWPLKPVP